LLNEGPKVAELTFPGDARVRLLSEQTSRETWDALASAETDVFVGDPARATEELASLFGRLGADPRNGVCVDVGCGPGRMTGALAARFERVLAVDVSPAMVTRARAAVSAPNVSFGLVSGERLDGVDDGVADTLVCYLVLQHLPTRGAVLGYLREFARVLAPDGEAFLQLPLLRRGLRARVWRLLRTVAVPAVALLSSDPARAKGFRGFRLTRREVERGLEAAGLRVVAEDEGPHAPYRYSCDVFLRVRRAAP
jgi:SAM-dependent methyltransferase